MKTQKYKFNEGVLWHNKFRMIAIFLKISKLFVTIRLIKLFYKNMNEDY